MTKSQAKSIFRKAFKDVKQIYRFDLGKNVVLVTNIFAFLTSPVDYDSFIRDILKRDITDIIPATENLEKRFKLLFEQPSKDSPPLDVAEYTINLNTTETTGLKDATNGKIFVVNSAYHALMNYYGRSSAMCVSNHPYIQYSLFDHVIGIVCRINATPVVENAFDAMFQPEEPEQQPSEEPSESPSEKSSESPSESPSSEQQPEQPSEKPALLTIDELVGKIHAMKLPLTVKGKKTSYPIVWIDARKNTKFRKELWNLGAIYSKKKGMWWIKGAAAA